MLRFLATSGSLPSPLQQPALNCPSFAIRAILRSLALLLLAYAAQASAIVLWSDLGATLVHETEAGSDILGGALKRDDSSTDTLYFKFHVDPLSDVGTEEYFAAFELYEGDAERLGVGNSLKAWAYSAFNTAETGENNKVFGDMDLRSARPESSGLGSFFPFEFPRRGIERTIVFKVQYVAGADDLVTIWLDPDLVPGATEENQLENRTTRIKANASFNQIRLRHGGGGGGWTFSDMAIATSFSDFVTGEGSDSSGPAAGARRSALPLTFQSWQREQGLPQNSVRALAQTHDGYLWVGSDDGLARFDGIRFVAFGMREGLPSGPVSVLFEDSRGILWIGTVGGGLTRWQDGRFTTLTLRDGLPSDSITALAEDSEGRLWIGTEAGLAIWEQGRFATLDAAAEFKGKAIPALFKDRNGTVWLGARGAGVFQFRGGKFLPVRDASVEGLLQDPHCLLVDHAGRTWIGAGDDFVLCHDGAEWRRYRIPRHLARPYVNTLAEEVDGTVWAGSVSEGLFQFKEGKLTVVNASSGLSDNFVESLLVDREGNLWVGTGAGLNRLRHSNLSILGQNSGLGYGPVQGLAEVAPGVIWAGKPSDGLYSWEGAGFSRLNSTDLTRRYPEINSLLKARDGSCWAGTAHALLHFKHPATAPDDVEPPALVGLNVTSLAEDPAGRVWAGTREGELWRLQGGNWAAQTRYSQPHAITALVPEKDGSMWIGTEGGGLYRFKDTVLAHFDRTRGLLSDLIRTLYLDPQGTLWIGTAGGGLSRWKNGTMANFTLREGLPDNTISQILEDDANRLWLGSNRGIACVSKRDLDELAAGKTPAVFPRVYGRLEGMLSEECTGGFYPAGLKTKSGLLWFSTLKGIAVVDPRPRAASAPAPTVVLEEALVDGTTVSEFPFPNSPTEVTAGATNPPATEAVTLRIPPGKHRIELRYTGLSFSAPERVRFRYRLEGLDPDWVEAGMRRTAFYSYVPPGEYHFRVIACNSDGVWNETGATMALTVEPHFWQVRWFIGLAAAGLLASVVGIVRFVEKRRLHHRLKQLEQERSLERERARIAQDLHDDLGSSLARISLLSGLVKADKDNPLQVETHAGKLSQSADQTVRALEEIVWAVRPDSDSLQSLVEYIAHFASELFEGNATRCRLDLPHDLPMRPLPPDMRHNIFLIVKEALTNALKHAAAKEVRVQTKADARSLEILIQDDGKGFEPAPPTPEGKRHGLGNMRHRAETIGGTLTLQSTPLGGTLVRLIVNFPDEPAFGDA
jgi:ligand-binding sensor domain-containing protein/signal transduction histidine kinase